MEKEEIDYPEEKWTILKEGISRAAYKKIGKIAQATRKAWITH